MITATTPYQSITVPKSVCLVCGKSLPALSSVGRKPHFCSSVCRDVDKFFNAFVDRLGKVVLSPSARKSFRGELFCVANTLGGGK